MKVEHLQYMLSVLSAYIPEIPPVTIDGIFGPATRSAVIAAQRRFGLPETGIVNFDTWYEIYDQFSGIETTGWRDPENYPLHRRHHQRNAAQKPVRPIHHPDPVPGESFEHRESGSRKTGGTAMRPLSSFVGQPIRSLQTMLRVIAEDDPTHLRIVPDGIYGPETTAAVSTFQRKHGLPVTGVTDHATWEAVVGEYTPALVRIDAAHPVDIIMNPGQVIRRGESNPHLYLAQAMLTVLADIYKSVAEPTHSGILDEPTADSLSSFQILCGLPMTGTLDKHTWKHLALHYPLATNLNNLP